MEKPKILALHNKIKLNMKHFLKQILINFVCFFPIQCFLSKVFECLFAVPSIDHQTLPMCKSKGSRIAAFDLLIELSRGCLDNYIQLHNLMLDQHLPGMLLHF